jgi:putative hydrolase of the HAD superfamily
MTIRAVFFDFDGTLGDGTPYARAIASACEAIANCCEGLAPEALLAANTTAFSAYWPTVEQQWTLGQIDTSAVSLEAWRRALRICGLQDESLVSFAFETHMRLASESHLLFDEVPEVLQHLSGRLPLGVITNGASDTQREKLRTTGIEALFDVIIVSGEIGAAKPSPIAFQAALEATGVSPQEALHVGDSLEADVAGALNAGLNAVWLNRHGKQRENHHPRPHHEIASLSELLQLL